MKSIFEQNGGTYTKVGDYYIPNLIVPECKLVGKYGLICKDYLKNYRKGFYNTLTVKRVLNCPQTVILQNSIVIRIKYDIIKNKLKNIFLN